MKRSCIILALLLSFCIVLSSCGSNAANDVPVPTLTNGNDINTGNAIEQATDGNNNTNNVENHPISGDTAPNPIVMNNKGEKTIEGEDELLWYFNGNGVTIERYITIETEFVIPPTIKVNGMDEEVTSIGERAFAMCPNLESITMPDTIATIGDDAFLNTPWFNNQPNGPLYIGGVLYGFVGAPPSGNFEIMDGTKTIRKQAFEKSVNLTAVAIPSSVTTIEDKAFSDCTGLTTVTLPDGITTIGDNVFFGCTGLTSVTIPDSVIAIGTKVFQNCRALTSITMPDSIADITPSPFVGTPWYINWHRNMPEGPVYRGTTLVGYKSADGNSSLPETLIVKDGTTTIDLDPDSGPLIGGQVFWEAASITVPDSVTDIRSNRHYWHTWWENQPEGPVYLGKVLLGYKGDMPANTTIEIKEGTVAIASSAFSDPSLSGKGYTTLTSIMIPNSVIIIGDRAFEGCTGLNSISIPNSVTTIGDRAFYGCESLTSVIIPEGVTVIGNSTFKGTGLSSIVVPEGVITIKGGAFSDCKTLTSVTIPDGVTTIGGNAFSGCENLTSITIPRSVTTIGGNAFSGCENLTITAPVGSAAQIYALNVDNHVGFQAQ